MAYDYSIDITTENSSHTKLLKLVGKGKTVLEIGCATGYMTRYMKEELGCQVSCVEIDAESAEKARPYCREMVVGDIESFDLAEAFNTKKFDVIMMADVLEHMKDAAGVLPVLRRMLHDDGYLLLSIPNGAHGSMALEILDGKWQYRNEGLLDRTHLHFFDKDNLSILLDESGFLISRLERVIIHPRDTEMKTPWDSYPRDVTAYLEKVNPEFQTYQFVVKSYPTTEQGWKKGLDDALTAERKRCTGLEEKLSQAQENIDSLKAIEAGCEAELQKREKEYLDGLQRELDRVEEEKKEIQEGYERQLSRLEDEKKELNDSCRSISAECEVKCHEISAVYESKIDTIEAELKNMQLEAVHFRQQSGRLQGENGDFLDEIGHLRSRLEKIEHSLFWRLIVRYRRMLDTWIPHESKRRRCYLYLVSRFAVLFRQGPMPFVRKIAGCFGIKLQGAGGLVSQEQPKVTSLTFPSFEKPLVSIIIPVYNQGLMTFHCLESILNRTVLPYEVVVIDNNSDEETARILDKMQGIKLIRNSDNKGFVEACNQGGDAATGENILFLNNDTEVTEGWLEAMVSPLVDDEVGLVGAKLVYPDGTLQEAGNIIWQDATGWNYGKGDDPDLPQYNYLKEVDYCSGACLLIRTPLWQELGGFDKRYAPAYYEDTDLCFSAREKGYKVLYQPEAQVIHFEGASAGTDLNSGYKRFQQINHEKFRDKWRKVLESDHFSGPDFLYLARERNAGRRVLVVDHYAPTFDKDSGSLRMLTLMQVLTELGYKVLFWPENRAYHEKYSRKLQQLGIEALYGNISFDDYLGQCGKHIDVIILSRPHVAVNYIYPARKLTNARLIYDTVDLHYLREERRAQFENVSTSGYFKDMELFLSHQSDDVLVVSDVEKEVLEKEGLQGKVSLISNIHTVDQIERPFEKRTGLMFIGGFDHTPNEDGIVWFVESILPLIRQKVPNIYLTIVGSRPSERVKGLASADIKVTGFVEDVRPFFAEAKIFICPLRYGAGVKGKVGQSMAYGLPVVMTSIGAEGMGVIDGQSALIADDEHAFAEKVISLIQDKALWNTLVQGGMDLIENRFSPQVVRKALVELLGSEEGES